MRRLTHCNMVLLIIGSLLICMILSIKLCATGFEVYGLSTKERYMHPEMTQRSINGLRAAGCDVNDIEAIKHLEPIRITRNIET